MASSQARFSPLAVSGRRERYLVEALAIDKPQIAARQAILTHRSTIFARHQTKG
jgi:hypothetical protein